MKASPLHNEMELQFFGTITASVSHELNNILSIINEYCGLLDDLIAASDHNSPLDKNKIEKISLNITNQIKREQEIIKLINRFAHRVDNSIVQFNLNELVMDITRLSQRFATLKKIELQMTIPKTPIFLMNNPFSLQHVIFLCFRLAINHSLNPGTVTILLEKNKSRALIRIASAIIEQNRDTKKMIKFISDYAKSLSGDIEIFVTDHSRQLQQISIPLIRRDG